MKFEESYQQINLFTWAMLQEENYPELKNMFHIPNGGNRNLKEAARFKKEGVRAGVPDIFLSVARQGFHGFYIEMKAPGKKMSEKQKEWKEQLESEGYKHSVHTDWEAASKEIIEYLAK